MGPVRLAFQDVSWPFPAVTDNVEVEQAVPLSIADE